MVWSFLCAACWCTAGETPCAEKITLAPSGTSESLSTNIAPLFFRFCTTCLLWTISCLTYTGAPYFFSVSSTICMARSTPAQNPLGDARIAFMVCFRTRSYLNVVLGCF